MNRIDLIRKIFQNTNFKRYLEIGCERGYSFLPLKVKYKVAVDPNFRIPKKRKLRWLFKVPENINNKFFEEKSDDFFINRKNYLRRKKQFDVVLVDGMHTFRASLNDVLNSFNYLNIEGIIIMHDCLPPHKAAATTYCPTPKEQETINGWDGIWCGDVWKTIVYLRRKHLDIVDICVVNTDFGLGLVRPKGQVSHENLKIDEELFSEIDRLDYKDLMDNIKSMLNLKSSEYLTTIIEDIKIRNKR